MTESWGEILYQAVATIAALVAAIAILNFLYNIGEGEPRVPLAALGLAAIIWLGGLCCRSVFDGSEADSHPVRH
jgi:hypothetical protein